MISPQFFGDLQYQDSPGVSRVRELELHVNEGQPDMAVQTAVANNERNTALLHKLALGRDGSLREGKVVYVAPLADWYRVQLSGGDADLPCARLTECNSQPFGVAATGPLAPNVSVLVWIPEGAWWGYILGVLPEVCEDAGLTFPDWISQGSNVGFKRERYYGDYLFSLLADSGVIDFGGSSPADSLACGEWGRLNTLGGGFLLDLLTTSMRVDETCGLSLFYLDRLARLAAYNYDFRSAAEEQMLRNDCGEAHSWRGATPYPWEALGLSQASGKPYRSVTDEDVEYTKPFGKYEPAQDDQQAFYRYREYGGYLGQGAVREICLPPASPPDCYRYGGDDKLLGVFREQIGLDGSYALQSAHSLSLSKRVLIPIPKQKILPEDRRGDGGAVAYKHAGLFGEGPEHKIAGEPAAAGELPHLLAAVGLCDVAAYNYNWKGLHPFAYHAGDFLLPEEGELSPFDTLQEMPDFSSLQGTQWLGRPAGVKARVDHRYGETDYYQTTAGLFVLPDGSVVIRDGYGSEILMSGGTIRMSAPGDIWRQAGRNCVDWSGDDHITRAFNSVDITAANKDVRLKAEFNFDILAGNNGQYGRLLLENQASRVRHEYEERTGEEIEGSGILLKAKDSEIACMGRDLYFRSGVEDGQSGDIFFDAARGEGQIRTFSRIFHRRLLDRADDVFVDSAEGDAQAVHSWSRYRSSVQSPLDVGGPLNVLAGGLTTRGDIQVVGGHVHTQNAQIFDGHVGELKGDGLAQTERMLRDIRDEFQKELDRMDDDYDDRIESRWYEDGQIGNDELQGFLAFSLRTEEQYNTGSFRLPEAYWQQLARFGGAETGAWTENPVRYQGEQLYPYPGKGPWKETQTYLQYEPVLFDAENLRDQPREDGPYEEPKLGQWQAKTLDGTYPIIG